MSYEFLQQYWWFLVSLLGALLVFMMFVQGANSLLFSLSGNNDERGLIINSTGKKWELTFTTSRSAALSSLRSRCFTAPVSAVLTGCG